MATRDPLNAVEFDTVSKKYLIRHHRTTELKEAIVRMLKRKSASTELFWALRDASFNIRRGEMFGFIGENGAGKSTTLQLIARTIQPDSGEIRVNGEVSALLELGAGFCPDLTGEENIFLNGSIMGLSRKQMSRKFDDIVAFSELGSFIDTPVKNYSSGMYMRLAFSVAIHVNPEILLIDEILAVGDDSFQSKCIQKIIEFRKQEKTIVFVSHNLEAVQRYCDRACLLRRGEIVDIGDATRVIQTYHRVLMGERVDAVQEVEERSDGSEPQRWGSREAEIEQVRFVDDAGREKKVYEVGESATVQIDYIAHGNIPKPVFGVAIFREGGVHVNGPNTKTSGFEIKNINGRGRITYAVESLPLMPGDYYFVAAIFDDSCLHPYDYWERCYRFRVIPGEVKDRYGVLYLPSRWEHEKFN